MNPLIPLLPNRLLFLGLDPGRKTGFAIYCPEEERIVRLDTTTFWDAYERVIAIPREQLVVVIEDPSQNPSTFEHGLPRSTKALRRRERLSRDVGANMREAGLLIEGIQRKGYRVHRARPRSGKLKEAAFNRITGYRGRSSQHARDAAMLVFGLKVPPPMTPREASLSLYAPPTDRPPRRRDR